MSKFTKIKIPNGLIQALDDFVKDSWDVKQNHISLLLNFKLALSNMNESLKEIMIDTESNNIVNIYKKDKHNHSVLGQETSMILFLSTWCIYIKQDAISTKDITNNFNFTNEYKLLRPALNYYLRNKLSIYYYDAKKCKQLLLNRY